MFNDRTIDTLIGKKILEKNAKERAEHVSSGKLSASMLGQPLQWQILKILGVPAVEIDEYTLRKFKRGNDIEDWLTQEMPGLIEKQKEIAYRNCVGFIDALVDTTEYQLKCGVIPHEVKSVSNAKYKRIISAKKADNGHTLQACLYALAINSKNFAIDYVAADDLRIETYVLETKDFAKEVEKAIDAFEEALSSKVIPDFEAKEAWQANPKYCPYPDWVDLTSAEAMEKLKNEFPIIYKKLTLIEE